MFLWSIKTGRSNNPTARQDDEKQNKRRPTEILVNRPGEAGAEHPSAIIEGDIQPVDHPLIFQPKAVKVAAGD